LCHAGCLEQLQDELGGGMGEIVAVEPAVIFSDNPCNEKDISKIPVFTVQNFQLEDSAKVEIEIINFQKDVILKSHCSVGKLQNMVNRSTFQHSSMLRKWVPSVHQYIVTCISESVNRFIETHRS
jgi:hypothetical protein